MPAPSAATKTRVLFAGTGAIGLPSLRFLLSFPGVEVVGILAQPDKPAGRKLELQPPPTKAVALLHGVPVLQPERIRRLEALEAVTALHPDLAVVMAYGQILPKAFLGLPPLGCINLHASLLPKYRGAAPIHAAILSGDACTGITVMHMDEGLDTGDILLARATTIGPRETCGMLHDRLGELAAEALRDALPLILAGRAPHIPQNHAEATPAPKLTKESGRVNWSAPASEADRLIRAMHPWPGPFTFFPGHSGQPARLKIHAAEPTEGSGPPGTVLRAAGDDIVVACGEGAMRLIEVQAEGRKRMGAREFLAGTPLAEGTVLGADA